MPKNSSKSRNRQHDFFHIVSLRLRPPLKCVQFWFTHHSRLAQTFYCSYGLNTNTNKYTIYVEECNPQ